MNRRQLLRTLGTAGVGVLAGCNTQDDTATPTDTPYDTTAPTDSDTRTGTPTPTGTPADDQAPTILDYRADPQEDGTALYVVMEGEDDRELGQARIGYGDRELVQELDGKKVTVDGTLQDTAATNPDFGRVAYILTDTAGNETRKHVQPDSTAPELAVETRPTDAAGEVVAAITAQDDIGLAEVHTLLNGESVQSHGTPGSAEYSDKRTIPIPEGQHGQQVPVGARARDWNGNTTEKDIESYVRKYDLMEDTRLDIGAAWISQQGGGFSQGCRDSYDGIEPAVGIYDEDPIPTDVTSRHIDQMTGHGITRVKYNHTGKPVEEDRGRVEAFFDSPLTDHATIEPFYGSTPLFRTKDGDWRDTLERDLPLIRDEFLTRDNVATIEDRPVLSTWNFISLAFGEMREKTMDDFGSYEAFVDEMRSHLRLEDGTDPYLILGKGPQHLSEEYPTHDLVQHFDGMTTWFPPGPWQEGEEDSWDDIIDRVETYFENNCRYAADHGMEFTPTIFPGYDDRGSGCDRAGVKYIPRSVERFHQLLQLAEEHATSDRIDIASWNDWVEGNQIEPGTFNGEDYGTDYLEVIEEFQQRGTE